MAITTRMFRWLCAFAGLLVAVSSQAQETPSVPSFPSRAEVVTVDVVVLDESGRPVRGLTKSDFIVEDDGDLQQIVAFEARDLEAPARPTADGEDAAPGRTLALIFDDRGVAREQCPATIEKIGTWVKENADPRDDLTLLTTSGQVAWRGRVATGRAELLHALSRIHCWRPRAPASTWRAYRIASGLEGNPGRPAAPPASPRSVESVGQPGVGETWHFAQLAMLAWRKRARALVGAIATFSRDEGAERGRKAAVIFTPDFIQDHEAQPAEQAIDVAQRANVALYFIDPRGLVAGDPIGRAAEYVGELAGAQQMAEETGGTLARHNDLKGALAQIADESSAYYLLGYASTRQPDGQWHKLNVKVARGSVTVRARRGYYASGRLLSEELAEKAQREATAEAQKGAQLPELAQGEDERSAGTTTPAPPALPARPPSQGAVPTFATEAKVVTVDAVVLDKDGRPVRGLRKSDFIVKDDGAPQEIVAFEVRDLKAPTRPAPEHGQSEVAGGSDAAPGRTLALIVDDLGLDARGPAALEAIRKWILEEADPRDEVTFLTSSGEVEWTGRMQAGQAELARALASIRPRGGPQLSTVDHSGKVIVKSEWESYEIAEGRQPCAFEVCMLAREVVQKWRHRARALVGAIERFAVEHADERARKTAIVFTQGFIRDDVLNPAEQAIDAAQRAGVALYFIDPRGLIAGGDVFPADRAFEATHNIDLAGALEMAEETGGTLVRNNDLGGALTEMVNEASAYYLLGYASTRQPDERWHKLDVRVARGSVTVRARRGYYASARPLGAERAGAAREATQIAAEAKTPEGPSRGAGARQSPSAEAAAGASGTHAATAAQGSAGARMPTFAARAEGVTVDVVVLDSDGRPVRDLSPGDFTVLENGRAQEIVTFARLGLLPQEEQEAEAERVEATERTLTFLVDDLGITPVNMAPTVEALSRWLSERSDPRDEVTLVTSSGDAWWSATVGEGREDLETVLRRLKGKKDPGGGRGAMSDYEASNIDALGSPIPRPGGVASGPPSMGATCVSNAPARDVLERVVNQWFASQACVCDPMNISASIRSCRMMAMARAREVYSSATQRAGGLLGAVERVSRGLAECRGRKSIVILSEGFLRDTDPRAYRRAVDASRHGNTSVSFVDVRGLIGLPMYGADQVALPAASDFGAIGAQTRLMDTAGGEQLAETTGGSMVRDTNDLEGAVARLADESSFYYLLGYQPDRALDGGWRKLRVKVARSDVTVRARRGYYATADSLAAERRAVAPRKKRKKKGEESLPVRALDPGLSTGGKRDAVPIRIAPYVFEMNEDGEVRVLVSIEVDTSQVTFTGSGDERAAELDVTLLAVSRDQPAVVPLDSRVELGVDAESVGGWWILSREVRLPAGVAQVRVLVRDVASGRSGLAARRLEIPRAGIPYMSTPVFALLDESGKGEPKLVPMARRRFPARGVLFCSYEVYPAPAREMRVMPHVMGSFRIMNERGRVVAREAPTLIGIGLGGVIQRSLAIPLGAIEPGRYELTLEANDRGAGLFLGTTQGFQVVAH